MSKILPSALYFGISIQSPSFTISNSVTWTLATNPNMVSLNTRTIIAVNAIRERKWDVVCKTVLEYYDKCYEYEKIGKENIKNIDLTDLKYDKSILGLINNIL